MTKKHFEVVDFRKVLHNFTIFDNLKTNGLIVNIFLENLTRPLKRTRLPLEAQLGITTEEMRLTTSVEKC